MKCEDVIERLEAIESGRPDDAVSREIAEHVAGCVDCRDALRGAEATRMLARQAVDRPASDLFARAMAAATTPAADTGSRRGGFWLGTGIGAAAAAALFAAALTLGLVNGPDAPDARIAEFYVSLGEPRDLNIAIDAETALPGATVSLTLYGGIELAGYGKRRHLEWTADLDAGINKLTLPVVALDESGGQIIVQLDHPASRQEFLVALRHEG
ncbi:MAG: hypothetical protein R3176_05435 [Woeseiaceae bacterium]|nr:hypothetical protein [Woeseiaceae bacterium]